MGENKLTKKLWKFKNESLKKAGKSILHRADWNAGNDLIVDPKHNRWQTILTVNLGEATK